MATKDEIASRLGVGASTVEIYGDEQISEQRKGLADALERFSGHGVLNPNSRKIDDYDLTFFKAAHTAIGSNTGLQCVVRNKATGQEIMSNVDQWPYSDYRAILTELKGLG